METKYIYCFIRKDISEVQRIIQCAHAAYAAGQAFGAGEIPPSICLFEVANELELMKALIHLRKHGIQYQVFHEDYFPIGLNSIVTAPISDEAQRAVFADFKSYRTD